MFKKLLGFVFLILSLALLLCGCAKNNIDVDALIKEAEEKGLKAVVSRYIVSDDGTVFHNHENKPVGIKWYDGLFLDKEKYWRFNFSYTPTEKADTWERVQIKVYADGTAKITEE